MSKNAAAELQKNNDSNDPDLTMVERWVRGDRIANEAAEQTAAKNENKPDDKQNKNSQTPRICRIFLFFYISHPII